MPHPTLRRLNDVLVAAYKRADQIEPRLIDALKPILEHAGELAADAFLARATDHMTAALLSAGADVTPRKGMVALYPRPDEAEALAEEGGEAPEAMHVTLAFLGEVDDETAEAIAQALGPVAASHPQLSGNAGGAGVFTDKGRGVPAIVLPDVPGLIELRQAVCEAIVGAGADYSRDHGYQPHITVAYRDGDPSPPEHDTLGGELHFDAIRVVIGDVGYAEIPLTGAPALTAAAWTPPAGDEIVNVDALVAELRTKTDPVRLALIEQSMTPALKAAGLSFDVTNPFTQRVLAQSGSQITNIAQTTQLNVMRIVRSSYENGLSIPDTATAIQGGMKEAAFTRATLIARTELAGAANGGSLAATQIVASETGMSLKKTWLTAPGAMFPRHEDYEGLDGQTVEMDAPFEVGGDQLDYPGDPSGSPEEVCNCRCTLVYQDASGEEQQTEEGEAPDAGEASSADLGFGGEGAAVDEEAVAADEGGAIDEGIVGAPEFSPDPYLGSLQKEKYTTGNKLGKLEHRLRTGEKGSVADVARAKALRAHRDELSNILSSKAAPEEMRAQENAYLDRALKEADASLNDPLMSADSDREQKMAEANAIKELLLPRKNELAGLGVEPVAPPPQLVMDVPMPAAQAVVAPVVNPEGLKADIEAIRGSTTWNARSAFQTLEPVGDVQKAQFDAVQRAGERMQAQISADPTFVKQQQAFESAESVWKATYEKNVELRGELEKAFGTSAARYQRVSDELSVARDKLLNQRAAMVKARAAMTAARRDALMRTLSEVRKIGPGPAPSQQVKFRAAAAAGDVQHAGAQDALMAAQKFVPRDWIEHSRELTTSWGGRGYHREAGGRAHIQISAKSTLSSNELGVRGTTTGLHELMHEVEATNKMVVDLEATFYRYRTSGGSFDGVQEKLVKMRKATGNNAYGADEVTREDKFGNAYIGRWYGGGLRPAPLNYEILSMGVEGLFSGSVELDEEYTRFILGILAML